ncbi:hypothetical protein [Nocardia sp. NPDC050406]|uniref:hypothetical protein n=1 Tax=Nocardia sp. NPDC050406 TaxID=3364318 RepID=UPI0037948149
MRKTTVARAGLAFATFAATLAVVAPVAEADTARRGACLTVVNNTPHAIRITMNTTPIGNEPGWSYTIPGRARQTLIDAGGNNLLSPDGNWDISGPGGHWWFDDKMLQGACNGTWNYTVN